MTEATPLAVCVCVGGGTVVLVYAVQLAGSSAGQRWLGDGLRTHSQSIQYRSQRVTSFLFSHKSEGMKSNCTENRRHLERGMWKDEVRTDSKFYTAPRGSQSTFQATTEYFNFCSSESIISFFLIRIPLSWKHFLKKPWTTSIPSCLAEYSRALKILAPS